MLSTLWQKIKDWFKATFGPVGSIINARLTMFGGLITGAVGFMDWSPLLNFFGTNTAFNQTQVIALGAIAFIKGLVDELVRRANDPLLKVTAAADAKPEVVKAKKEIKKLISKLPEVK